MLAKQHGQVFPDGIQNLAGFLDKDFEDFIVNQIVLLVTVGCLFWRWHFISGRFVNLGFRSTGLLTIATTSGCHRFRALDQLCYITGGLAIAEFMNQ